MHRLLRDYGQCILGDEMNVIAQYAIAIGGSRQCDVVQQVCRGMRAFIKEYRQTLVSIVQTVVLCGHQNIAFRGHRDNNKSMSKLIGQHECCGLDLAKLCGQGYDGASNMFCRLKGAAAIIRAQYSNATYVIVHCNSHVFNLSVVNVCELQPMRNMISTLKEVCIFL